MSESGLTFGICAFCAFVGGVVVANAPSAPTAPPPVPAPAHTERWEQFAADPFYATRLRTPAGWLVVTYERFTDHPVTSCAYVPDAAGTWLAQPTTPEKP